MRFENTFAVQAPIEEVWAAMLDIERVAPCMPGAEVLERVDDDAYKVGVKIKLGPMTMTYRGQIEIVERDDATHTATMRAKAKEARGQGTAEAHVHMHLAEDAGATQATMATELALSGRAAAMGQGVISDVSAKLIETFAGNLAQILEPAQEPAHEPASVNGSAAAAAASEGPPEGRPEEVPPEDAPPLPSPPPPPPPPLPKPQPPPLRATPASDSLPVGQIVMSVITGRLSNPRTLAIATAALALIAGAVGYRAGRRR